ncbi:hypothetical protein GCM10010361_65140 [Streptomyces olivaceiscleroticus]|uniref:ABC transporter permease n=1 Tax=Streptomyces olivaceiscleroticus TaxID=68245 RepID=A0ABN1B5Q0_9ACTN
MTGRSGATGPEERPAAGGRAGTWHDGGVSAPLTPPDRPSNQQPGDTRDPWPRPATEEDHVPTSPQEYGGSDARPFDGDGGPGLRGELREAVLIVLVTTVCGALLGVLWAWLAPHVPLISDGKAVYLKNAEGEESIGADGTFLLLGFALGVVSAAIVFLWRRRGGVPLVVALVVGGLLASVLAWRLGMLLGPEQDVVAHAKAAGKGVAFDAPLRLQAKGALLAWPIGAVLANLLLTGAFGPRDPEPFVPDWHAPQPPRD